MMKDYGKHDDSKRISCRSKGSDMGSSYGSISEQQQQSHVRFNDSMKRDSSEMFEEDDELDDGELDDEDYMDDLRDEDELQAEEDTMLLRGSRGRSCLSSVLGVFSDALRVLVHVDNIWDSPDMSENGRHVVSKAHKLAVLFWFLVLALAYAAERASFKILVDRAGPFRLMYAEAIAGLHALLLGMILLLTFVVRCAFRLNKFKSSLSLGLPLTNVAFMAILDTVHLLFAMISAAHVKPVLTVILVQFTIPLTAAFTPCLPASTQSSQSQSDDASPNNNTNKLTTQHILGSAIIFIAVILGLCPSFIQLFTPHLMQQGNVSPQTAWNTLIFTLTCIPAAASILYKEHTLLKYKQPVDPNLFNFFLSLFTCLFAAIISPLLYSLQGLAQTSDWTQLYSNTQITNNFLHATKCFLQILPPQTANTQYPDIAKCNLSWLILLIHVLSILAVTISIDKIVHARATNIMYRGISAGIILAVGIMYLYERFGYQVSYGPIVNGLHAACTVILILGSEIYHRVSLPMDTFETVFPEVHNIYEEEDE